MLKLKLGATCPNISSLNGKSILTNGTVVSLYIVTSEYASLAEESFT